MEKTYKTRVLILILISAFPCTGVWGFNLPDLLPGDGDISGWSRSGDYYLAQNEEELRLKIDGAADLFLRHEFKAAVFQDYLDTLSTHISIQIFDQTSPSSAKIIYDSTSIGGEIPVTGLGEEARRLEELFTVKIEFLREHYYIKGEVSSKEKKYQKALGEFMAFIDNGILTRVDQKTWGCIKKDYLMQ
jgi:hypothetical protein